MTPNDFLKETIEQYHRARLPIYSHDRIFRGESRCISSEIEDLFAKYLIDNLSQDIAIYINQIITTGSGALRQRLKPDLVITKDDSILSILDLKMDLRYKRNSFANYWKDRDAQIPLLHKKEFSLFEKVSSSKTRRLLKFSENTKLFYVIISDQNIKEESLRPILEMREKMRHSDIFVLSHGLHPNVYEMTVDDVLRKIAINTLDFERLTLQLNQLIQQHDRVKG